MTLGPMPLISPALSARGRRPFAGSPTPPKDQNRRGLRTALPSTRHRGLRRMLAKVTVDEAARAAADAPEKMRLELVAPFVEAAGKVLLQECGETARKGSIHRVRSPQTSNDVS